MTKSKTGVVKYKYDNYCDIEIEYNGRKALQRVPFPVKVGKEVTVTFTDDKPEKTFNHKPTIMKRSNRFRLFLETIHTLAFIAGVGFICWWLWQLLPMLVTFD